MKKKNIIIINLINVIIVSLIFCLNYKSLVYAADYTKYFYITSPEYVETITYTSGDPSFKISAPQGWYMAMKKENISGEDRAFFSKSDPEKPLSQGIYGSFGFPIIMLKLSPNPSGISALEFIRITEEMAKSDGAKILVNEEIQVDNKVGVHFVCKATGQDSIADTYLFTTKSIIIDITGIYKEEEFETVGKEVKEAINSIKFLF